jgi:hypothetical protein
MSCRDLRKVAGEARELRANDGLIINQLVEFSYCVLRHTGLWSGRSMT